jgi:hypothetical protein
MCTIVAAPAVATIAAAVATVAAVVVADHPLTSLQLDYHCCRHLASAAAATATATATIFKTLTATNTAADTCTTRSQYNRSNTRCYSAIG